MISFMGFVFLSGFFLGMFAILAVEAAGLMYLLKKLNRKRDQMESKLASHQSVTEFNPRESFDFCLNKQGVVWILELDEGIKNWMKEKSPREYKRKRDVLEIHPHRKFARIKDHKLILSDADGTQTTVSLTGCSIEAVSGSALPTRKWAKRFPIKVESKVSSDLYKGNQVFYIYLETSWDKESWCKALRLAACENQERFIWYSTKLKEDFRSYLTSLNAAYPSFMKHSVGFGFETPEKGNRTDGSSSRVRLFLKKFSRKRSNKSSVRSYQDSQHGSSSGKSNKMGDEPDLPIFSRSVSHSSHISGLSDGDSEEKFELDEGTLAWNLLISRLFFDLKRKTGVKNSMQTRIQRMLSNMRTPSYIGELVCSGVDTGNLAPHIHATRVLPMEMSGVWAFELDIEYSGEAVIDVETCVDIREVDLHKGITDARSQPSSAGEITSKLVDGAGDYEKQLVMPVETVGASEVKNGGAYKANESKCSKGTKAAPNGVSRWKSILKTIAEQVSQVPISFSIRVSSLRGTLRVHMKPPPSDQLWFGFTSMPDVDFDLASSVGEHKITNSHVAMFLINRFKTAIREAVVLPNCESLTIPWMIAEKDDWVQRKAAPFMWLNQESDHNSAQATETRSKADKPPISSSCCFPPISSSCVQSEQMQKTANATEKPTISEALTRTSSSFSSTPAEQVQKAVNAMQKAVNANQQPNTEAEAMPAPSTTATVETDKSFEELKTPLLLTSSSEKYETNSRGSYQSPSRSFDSSGEDDSKGKRMGRRARMLDLGKKMGEKLEEKRRHMEEKSRQIVEKMRGPS